MSKFEWDLDLLLKKEKEFKEKIKFYQEQLNIYRALINNYSIKINGARKHSIDYYDEDVEDNISCFSLGDFKENILCDSNVTQLELLISAMDVLKKYYYTYGQMNLGPCYFNNNELVEYVNFLASKIPNKDFVEIFNSFSSKDKKLLHIKHELKLPTANRGLTFIDTENHIPYGLVARQNTIHDIITLGHELFHMVVRQYEAPFFLESNKTIYTETEGYFASLLFSDLLLQEGFSKEELDFLNRFDLQTVADVINDTFVTISALNNIGKDGTINFKQLRSYLKSYDILTPINKKNFKGYLSSYFNEDANDAFSYLVALDLYNLYKQDPEKSLYNLLKVPNLEGENIEKELESINVTFYQDGYQNLDNHCKKLLKTKTTSI